MSVGPVPHQVELEHLGVRDRESRSSRAIFRCWVSPSRTSSMPIASSSSDAGEKCSSTAFFRPGTDCERREVLGERRVVGDRRPFAGARTTRRSARRADGSSRRGGDAAARRTGPRRLLVFLQLLAPALGRPPGVRRRELRVEELLDRRADQLLRDDLGALLLALVDHLDLAGDRRQRAGRSESRGRRPASRRSQAAALEVRDQDLDAPRSSCAPTRRRTGRRTRTRAPRRRSPRSSSRMSSGISTVGPPSRSIQASCAVILAAVFTSSRVVREDLRRDAVLAAA